MLISNGKSFLSETTGTYNRVHPHSTCQGKQLTLPRLHRHFGGAADFISHVQTPLEMMLYEEQGHSRAEVAQRGYEIRSSVGNCITQPFQSCVNGCVCVAFDLVAATRAVAEPCCVGSGLSVILRAVFVLSDVTQGL